MSTAELAKLLGDACYLFLTVNFLWGLYNVILIWRRLKQLRFRSAEQESEFVDTFVGHVKGHNYDTAAQMCDYDYRAVPRLCLLILNNRDLEFPALRQLVASRMKREIIDDVEHRISWIVTVIKSGPLLGLFGTVLGMMAAFHVIGTGIKVQPSMIAKEISIALICTAMGLGTAIPLGYILSILTIRLRLLQESMDSSLSRILEQFRR
jgi:biopolymer transport protein ExbB/TolQ